MKTCLSRRRAALRPLWVGAVVVPCLSAQPAPETRAPESAEAGPRVVLSPFRVDASQDRGYSVTRDVSGSRLDTDLKDIAAPITVFTQEMMRDLNAINVNQALDFAPNTAADENGINNQDTNPVPVTSRGLRGMTVTQDFFPVGDDLDVYKVDRIGFGRGPNSILFGVGVPGGTITASTKQALFRNAYELQTRFDTWGSARGMIDASHVLVPDRLAVRAVALQQYKTTATKPQYKKDRRLFLTATAKLLDRPGLRTTLRGNYERIRGIDVYPNGGLPRDNISFWLAAGSPTSPLIGAGASAATRPPGTGNQSSGNQLVYINDPVNNIPIMSWRNALTSTGPAPAPVLDETVYPYDRNLKGDDGTAPRGIEHASVFLEQQIGKNFFIEAAAFQGERDVAWPFQVGGIALQADPNELLPNGAPNPNVGKPFVQYDGRSVYYLNDDDVYRVTASYRLDFEEIKTGLGRWLGWHQLFALYEHNDRERVSESLQLVNTTPLSSYSSNLANPANRVFMRSYLDYANGVWSFAPGSSASDYTSGGVTARSMPVGQQSVSLQKFDSTVFAMQNHLWRDRIVTTLGWREDAIQSFSALGAPDARGLRPLGRTLIPSKTGEGSLRPSSRGVVFHAFKWLSLHYSESNNFSGLASVRRNAFGEILPATSGESHDYGATLTLLGGKLSLKFDIYETSQVNASGNANADREINQLWEVMGLPERKLDPWPATKDTFDVAAKGWEATFVYNPTPNWRIYGTLSHNAASRTNIYHATDRYIQENLAAWRAVPGETTIADGRTFTRAIDEMMDTLNVLQAQEGAQEYNLRKWNGSLVTHYGFRKGWLKGAGVGGSLLYRGDATIGYPLVGRKPIKDQPYIEKGYTTVNLNFSYERRLRDRYTWRTQLTVANALDFDGRVMITGRSGLGRIVNGGARWLPGTTGVLTTGVRF